MFTANQICSEYARTAIRVKTTQLIRRRGFKRSERPDIEQDLMVYLPAQADRFGPSRSSLNTFVARVVDSWAAMLVRDRKRLKRCPETRVFAACLLGQGGSTWINKIRTKTTTLNYPTTLPTHGLRF